MTKLNNKHASQIIIIIKTQEDIRNQMAQFTSTLEDLIISFTRHNEAKTKTDTNNTPLKRNVTDIIRQIKDPTEGGKVAKRRK